MPKNSFISSFKTKAPVCFLVSAAVFLFLNGLVLFLYRAGVFEDRDSYLIGLGRYRAAQDLDAAVLGDSRVFMIRPAHVASALGVEEKSVELISFGGATPRTLEWYFENTSYSGIKPGGTCVIFVSPMSVNANNRLFERTIGVAFDTRLFISELLLAGRWQNVKYYIANHLLPIQHYKNHLKYDVKEIIGKIMGREDFALSTQKGMDLMAAHDKAATAEQMRYWLGVYKRENLGEKYELDDYQLKSLKKIIENLHQKNIRVVLVTPPIFSEVVELLGGGFNSFSSGIAQLSLTAGIQWLDYSTENGYEFADTLHLVSSSADRFSQNMVQDLQKGV